MEFGGNNKRRVVKYPLRVQLYDEPPEDDISLEQFYLLGKKRMEGKKRYSNTTILPGDIQFYAELKDSGKTAIKIRRLKS